MFKKLLTLCVLFALIGCHSTKSPISTSKSNSQNKKSAPTYTKKKSYSRSSNNDRTSSVKNKEYSEVIESTSKTVVSTDIIGNYIQQYKNIAMSNMKMYGIPASIILAQGILESGAGRGDLALTANNHFGIKCHTGWEGESVRHDDDASQECFRKYKYAAESFKDHAEFLTGRSRYASLFSLSKSDYEAWAKGLRAAGYATDPRYPNKLISYIERYNLAEYDAMVLGTKFTPTENQNTAIAYASSGSYHEVQKGDTLYSISKKYNMLVSELKQKNNLSENIISIGQKLLIQ